MKKIKLTVTLTRIIAPTKELLEEFPDEFTVESFTKSLEDDPLGIMDASDVCITTNVETLEEDNGH